KIKKPVAHCGATGTPTVLRKGETEHWKTVVFTLQKPFGRCSSMNFFLSNHRLASRYWPKRRQVSTGIFYVARLGRLSPVTFKYRGLQCSSRVQVRRT